MRNELLPIALAVGALLGIANGATLDEEFQNPPDSARPWVYWINMDGHLTKEGITADFESMKRAGLGGMIYMDVDVGVPRGDVPFMSDQWRENFKHAVLECERLGLEFTTITGPGWTGTGGPWIKPEQSMQHLVPASVNTEGPQKFDAILPLPQPRVSAFHTNQTPAMRAALDAFYKDVAVYAFPRREPVISDVTEKAFFHRQPYSSAVGTRPYLPSPTSYPELDPSQVIDPEDIVDLTDRLQADGRLEWDVPPGEWTILRMGRRSTGSNTRPAPAAGLGFESNKFDKRALDAHFEAYFDTLLELIGPRPKDRKTGFTGLDADSWEMSAQNWTPGFREEFKKRRGYDPWPYFPAYSGRVVGSREVTERFLWDVRMTSQELILENHMGHMKKLCHERGLKLAIEPYDMNPTVDLDLGALADIPMGEFWANTFNTAFSCREAASIGHLMGKPIVAAEAFTSVGTFWKQTPWTLKNQGDWAFAAGINRFVIVTFAHQPWVDRAPGMMFSGYGLHWERTQTFWPLVDGYHEYLARCSHLLQQGTAVADVLYLTPEGAPHIFSPPASAMDSLQRMETSYSSGREWIPDKRGYGFDGCSPNLLMARASVKEGRIAFPGGTSYRLLVLPRYETMTPELLAKIKELIEAGASVVGYPPAKSPSLEGYPAADQQVQALAKELWGELQAPPTPPATSFTASSSHPSFPPQLAHDNHPETRWISDGDQPGQGPTPEKPEFLQWGFPEPRTIAALSIEPYPHCGPGDCELQSSDDGESFTTICRFTLQPEEDKTIAFDRTRAKFFRLVMTSSYPYQGEDAWNVQIAEVALQEGSKHDATPKGEIIRRDVGHGAVYWIPWGDRFSDPLYPHYDDTAAILKQMGLSEDFASTGPVRYAHRRTDERDIYFISNKSDAPLQVDCTFRAVAVGQPELWDPTDGRARTLPQYHAHDGRTTIPFNFDARQSFFVIFPRVPSAEQPATANRVNFPATSLASTLEGPWQVSFDPKWGGPEHVTFDTLEDWSKNEQPGIKFYSGIATYRRTFARPEGLPDDSSLWLDLGTVHEMARVRLNGKEVGVVWSAPWRVNLSDAVQPGENRLEIEVANLWPNRLIGDAALPPEKRFTWTIQDHPYRADSELLPSGLLGPVTLNRSAAP